MSDPRARAPLTILHIEDDPANRLLVKKLLKAEGMIVVDAETGLEGVQKAIEIRPHLVLIDLNIPDLDGFEVALRLRSEPLMAKTPLVAITAEGDRETSLAMGCDGFIQKPINARKFADEVRSYLEGRKDRASAETNATKLRAQSEKIVRHLEAKVAELVAANERLREMDVLRKEFYRNVSHELATPLTPIVGYLSMLLNEELGPLARAQMKALRSVDDCAQRLRNQIDSLLDVTGLETGRMRFSHRDFDLRELLIKVNSSYTTKLQDARITLITDIPNVTFPAYGDDLKLGRALQHILDNACKFTPASGAIGIRLRANVQAQSYEIFVADSGPGIPETQLNQIFQPFFQVDGSPTRQFGGVGLGLAVAKKVAQALGGDVRAVSHADDPIAGTRLPGAGFYLTIALRAPEEVTRM